MYPELGFSGFLLGAGIQSFGSSKTRVFRYEKGKLDRIRRNELERTCWMGFDLQGTGC